MRELESWPVQSPSENTRNMYIALSNSLPTLLYHLTEMVDCKLEPEDIFIGHPYFPYTKDRLGVTEIAMRSRIRPKIRALIAPLHCDTNLQSNHINRDFLEAVDALMPYADVLFAIMGEYWWKEWDRSPYRHWKSKMIRLDMAVDSRKYPRVKRTFNPPGKRGYFFIGNSDDPRKGCDFLSVLMGNLSPYPRGWIGSGPEIPNTTRISSHRALTPKFMSEVAETYDFFISAARADPNPTTILECMAWGFPVFCTPQSGYFENSYLKNIYIDDAERSISILNEFQFASETDLLRMAATARNDLESQYNWNVFTGKILENLKLR
jgi:hypothetical protein